MKTVAVQLLARYNLRSARLEEATTCTSNPKQKAKSNLHSHIITCCVLLNYNINNTMNKGSRPSIYQHGSFYLLLRLEGTFLQSKGQITGTPKLD